MGFNFYYSDLSGDVRDPKNSTGRCPPFEVEVSAKDGSVCLRIGLENESVASLRQCCLSHEQAERLIAALREALRDARR